MSGTECLRKFKIEYRRNRSCGCEQKWEEGYLLQCYREGKAFVWLKSREKVTLRKGSVEDDFVKKLHSSPCAGVLSCAGYHFRVVGESESKQYPRPHVSQPEDMKSKSQPEDMKSKSSESIGLTLKSQRNFSDKGEEKSEPPKGFLDPVLLRKMRSYQVEAASFLLNRLQDGKCKYNNFNNGNPLTGAILADDMGTGKTLVGLSVVWALCRHGQGKGVIVCPSSLIQNWRKEINMWLPKTSRSTIYISGGKAGTSNDIDVHSFVSSHPSVHPLLVISYDMFRVYAAAFNTIQSLNTLLCDEGHRLKSSEGTKTSVALSNCIAMQRLVLTGTPIQNNLDELYSVVNFVVPGYLGTLEEFQAKYANAITAANDPASPKSVVDQAESAKNQLGLKLRSILMRRSGDTLLSNHLPPRNEFAVAISMNINEASIYDNMSQELIRGVSDHNPLKRRLSTHEEESLDDSPDDDNFCPRTSSEVLSGLQRLRVLCSSGFSTIEDRDRGKCFCSKLMILRSILKYLKREKCKEKLVIASNFISTLDTVVPILKECGLRHLRIDGSVSADKRQGIVELFNDELSPFAVCLISVKAGGVGLNLVGANHLVLLEPDYNPATDKQAIGRVWRVGQKKEVHIYRLVYRASIEESIICRQRHKDLLSSVITNNEALVSNKDKTKPSGSSFFSVQSPGDLRELVLPRNALDSEAGTTGGNENDKICAFRISTDNSFHQLGDGKNNQDSLLKYIMDSSKDLI